MPSDRPSKPHGTFTPASTIARVLSRAGYAKFHVRARTHTAFAGHRCSWDRGTATTRVTYTCADDSPVGDDARRAERADMLTAYEELLTAKGYVVQWVGSGYALSVYPRGGTW